MSLLHRPLPRYFEPFACRRPHPTHLQDGCAICLPFRSAMCMARLHPARCWICPGLPAYPTNLNKSSTYRKSEGPRLWGSRKAPRIQAAPSRGIIVVTPARRSRSSGLKQSLYTSFALSLSVMPVTDVFPRPEILCSISKMSRLEFLRSGGYRLANGGSGGRGTPPGSL